MCEVKDPEKKRTAEAQGRREREKSNHEDPKAYREGEE
jgi:hypothetical protein